MDFGNKKTESQTSPISTKEDNKISNHMVKSVIAAILFTPAGVVPLVNSFLVVLRLESGKLDSARKYSDKANTWGNSIIFIAVMFIILAFMLGATNYIAEYMMY